MRGREETRAPARASAAAPPRDADVLVVGAGMAGLSLAVALAERGFDGRVLLVDAREDWDVDDRTWCSFAVGPHPFVGAVAHRWARVRVREGGRERLLDVGRTPYVHVPARDFYRAAFARLGSAKRFVVRGGVRVDGLVPEPGGVRAETSAGVLRARWAFDARPALPPPGGTPRLFQHFRGFFVRTEAPRFEPGVATLMDFDVDQGRGLRFRYVLPFAADRALVEDTYFTETTFPIGEALLEDLGAHVVEREEGGVIPMTVDRFPVRPGIRRIGLAGGVAKPSTGYAFEFAQRDAAQIADALVRGAPPPPFRRQAFLDEVFLGVLARDPAEAPALFYRLFDRNPPARLVRFLSERATPLDHLGVMASLPKRPFIAEALRRVHARAALFGLA